MGDQLKILKVEQWGTAVWTDMQEAFSGCSKLDVTAADVPNLSSVTNFSNLFIGCNALIGNSAFNNWDTSQVTNMQGAFSNCSLFNQPIGNWNTSNVTNMVLTFALTFNFNQPLNTWDTSKVNLFNAMFLNAKAFNQPIGNWDTSSALELELMFASATKFNQPIGDWNTANVFDFGLMFQNATAFNQPIGNWNTSSGVIFNNMFQSATSFNQNIGNWNTGSELYMNFMFANAASFNQNISGWNTFNVQSMTSTFNGASVFNQNLGNWQIPSLIQAQNIFLNSAIDCQNYDNILYFWGNRPNTPSNVNISNASPLKYSNEAAVAARNLLIATKGWTIMGDIYDPACQSSILNISEINRSDDFYIYPNPASDFLFIKTSQKMEEVNILDFSGRIILKFKNPSKSIDVSKLPAGNYILNVKLNENQKTFQFIKK